MTFTLFFPNNKDAEPYRFLEDEEEVYAAIKEEVEKCGEDMAEPIWDDGTEGLPFSTLPDNEDESMRRIAKAYKRGVDAFATLHAPSIHKELWVRYREGEEPRDIAINNITYSKLPDGTAIALKEEDDE